MLQQDSPVDIQRRLPFLAGFIVLFTIVLLVRLWYLQAVKGDYYQEQAESNRIRPVKLRPPRGIIYDRYGRPLVENVLTFDVSLVPEDAPDLDATITKLSTLIKVSPAAIRAAISLEGCRRSSQEHGPQLLPFLGVTLGVRRDHAAREMPLCGHRSRHSRDFFLICQDRPPDDAV